MPESLPAFNGIMRIDEDLIGDLTNGSFTTKGSLVNTSIDYCPAYLCGSGSTSVFPDAIISLDLRYYIHINCYQSGPLGNCIVDREPGEPDPFDPGFYMSIDFDADREIQEWSIGYPTPDTAYLSSFNGDYVSEDDDSLTWRAAAGTWSKPSVVPIPAAVWLFGTALIGLVGFSKRRKAA